MRNILFAAYAHRVKAVSVITSLFTVQIPSVSTPTDIASRDASGVGKFDRSTMNASQKRKFSMFTPLFLVAVISFFISQSAFAVAVSLTSDIDIETDAIGFTSNANQIIPDATTHQSGSLVSGISIRMFFRVYDLSCEDEAAFRITDPTGTLHTLTRVILFTPIQVAAQWRPVQPIARRLVLEI